MRQLGCKKWLLSFGVIFQCLYTRRVRTDNLSHKQIVLKKNQVF